jgi:hypothetical protein
MSGMVTLHPKTHVTHKKSTFLIARRSFASNLRILNPKCLYVRLSSVRELLAHGKTARAHMQQMWRTHTPLRIILLQKKHTHTHTRARAFEKTHTI